MEDAVDEGLVGLLGISNVSVDQLDALLDRARIRQVFVQNRCLARASWDAEVRALCRTHDVIYQAFFPTFRKSPSSFETTSDRDRPSPQQDGSAGSISFGCPARDAAAHWHNRRRSHAAKP